MTLLVLKASWEQWDGLVDRMEQRTVFHRASWLRTLEAAYGLRTLLVTVVEDGACVALWPWLWLRKGPVRVIGSPLPGWSTPYMGPLFASGEEPTRIVRKILASGVLGSWSYAACRVLDHRAPVDLPCHGFELHGRFQTCWIDLSRDEDALWSALKGSCRSRVRKARKSGVTIRVEENDDYIPDFWEVAKEVFSRSGRKPTFTHAFLRELHDRAFDRGELLVVSAWHDGRRIASLVLPHDDVTAMYWAGGAHPAALAQAPNNLLHWEAIRECRRRGLLRYDFISTKGGPGRFKKTFGPEIAEVCSHWEASRPALLRYAKELYERTARRAQRLS